MAINTEKKLMQLERELESLKATYKIYGGAMELFTSFSSTFSVGGSTMEAKIKFTPDYDPSGKIIVSSLFYENVDTDGVKYNFSTYAYTEIQDGSSDVIIRVPAISGTIKVGLTSTVPGTFTIIS